MDFCEAPPPIFRCGLARSRSGTDCGVKMVTHLVVERLREEKIGDCVCQQ